MKTKILALNFQRNGVAGEGFYSALVTNLPDAKGTFVITFDSEYDKEGETIDIIDRTKCRVVMIEGKENPHYEGWRGDQIAYDLRRILNDQIEKENVEDLFDLMCLYRNRANPKGYQWEVNHKPAIETQQQNSI